MKSTSEHKINGFLVLLVCLAIGINVYANGGGETVTVPVIVNVVGDTNAGDVEAAVEEASQVLGQAGVNLDIARINTNVQYGDGDSNLTAAEGDTAEVLGEGELFGTWGSGTGLKLTIANNVWVESPTTNGWARHENQVAFVEPDANTNKMGKTIAHEIAHLLTLSYDLNDGNDPNRLMWWTTARRGLLDANEVNEIFPMAKWRGRPKFVPWKPPPPGKKGLVIDGWYHLINGRGWILDSLYDQTAAPGSPPFDPCDPNWGCGDIRTAGMFWDRPMDPCDNIIFRIRVKERFDIDSFFDVTFKVKMNMDPDPNIDAELSMHVYARPPDPMLYGEALLTNYETGLTDPFELIIHENYKFDGEAGPILSDYSLECDVPAEHFDPGSDPFQEWACTVDSTATFPDDGFDNDHPVTDQTEEFTFKVDWNDDPCDPCVAEERHLGVFQPYGDTGTLGIAASGFPPGSDAKIILDGQVVGMTAVASNGTVKTWIAEPLEGQNHTCKLVAKVIDPVDPNITRYTNATAYFRTCAEGAIDGDLDGDCAVNFKDLAVLAENWLEGV